MPSLEKTPPTQPSIGPSLNICIWYTVLYWKYHLKYRFPFLYCPGLGSTSSPTTTAPSPVSISQHLLRTLDDGKKFECVNCKLVALDFETLHSVPCRNPAQKELHEQRAKLNRLKQLQQLESVLKAKSDQQVKSSQASVKVGDSQPSLTAPGPNLIPVRATMLSERKFPEQLKNHALLGFISYSLGRDDDPTLPYSPQDTCEVSHNMMEILYTMI